MSNYALNKFADSMMWHDMTAAEGELPDPRHCHTAVVHDSAMWVFGGITDLQERADLWKYSFRECLNVSEFCIVVKLVNYITAIFKSSVPWYIQIK